jgi:hypothetical protein
MKLPLVWPSANSLEKVHNTGRQEACGVIKGNEELILGTALLMVLKSLTVKYWQNAFRVHYFEV